MFDPWPSGTHCYEMRRRWRRRMAGMSGGRVRWRGAYWALELGIPLS
jgi:hypothetical protein